MQVCVIGQESAEAILGEGSHPKSAWETGNEPGEEKSPGYPIYMERL